MKKLKTLSSPGAFQGGSLLMVSRNCSSSRMYVWVTVVLGLEFGFCVVGVHMGVQKSIISEVGMVERRSSPERLR